MAITNDDEQLEALQRWWVANWKPLIAGVVLGLIVIGGWQGWNYWQGSQALSASRLYSELRQHIAAGQFEQANALAERLADDYAGTPYAAQAQLAVAAQAVAADGETTTDAVERLAWVRENAADAGLGALARLREARALWAAGQPDEALAAIDESVADQAFAALYLELRGDILTAQGRDAAAREAYRQAMAAAPDAAVAAALQRKLADLEAATS